MACDGPELDLNMMTTLLNEAVLREDYEQAASFRDAIRSITGGSSGGDWSALGLADWLCDWLERLNYKMPTPIQRAAMVKMATGNDAAVVAATGSGKTLAYLLPLVSRLSEDLLTEDLSGYLASFLEGGRRRIIQDTAADERLPTSVPTPAILIVVPTRELGVQVSLLIYRLFGGGTGNPTLQPFSHPSRYQPGNNANMFTYKGPRRVKVAGVWDEQALYATAEQDLLKGVHVIIGTPSYLARAAVSGNLRLENVRALAVDEADACFQEEEMDALMRQIHGARERNVCEALQTVLIGASLSSELIEMTEQKAFTSGIALITESSSAGIASAESAAGGLQPQRVPAGHKHEYVTVAANQSLAVLCRLLRDTFSSQQVGEAGEEGEAGEAGGVSTYPRAIVYASSADEAISAAGRLQNALWRDIDGDATAGLWGLSVLLPSAEESLNSRLTEDDKLTVLESSLRVMEMFRANQTSVLVTTASATRGLDFPQVTHIFNLGIVGKPVDYLHRAGRVGRVGQSARGQVLSVLESEEVPQLLALGETLHFRPNERQAPPPSALTEETEGVDAVKLLTDLYNLY